MTFDPEQETAPSPASNHVRQGRSTLWHSGGQRAVQYIKIGAVGCLN